jgi:hypothetical protein
MLLLLVIYLLAAGVTAEAPLRKAWRSANAGDIPPPPPGSLTWVASPFPVERTPWKLSTREDPTHAMLFASCVVSADSTTINGIVCSQATNTEAIGCMYSHTAYVCNGSIWISVLANTSQGRSK